MSDQFVRQSGADSDKGLDAELLVIKGIPVFRQRVVVSPTASIYRFDESVTDTLYCGVAVANALDSEPVWSIKKIVLEAQGSRILWPNGSADYTFSWVLRNTYTYL